MSGGVSMATKVQASVSRQIMTLNITFDEEVAEESGQTLADLIMSLQTGLFLFNPDE